MSNMTHSGKTVASANGFDIIDCESCGFKHIFPIPSHEELAHIYKHEYYTKDKPDYINRDLQDKDWWEMKYAARYAIFENTLSEGQHSLLDIGSGPGLFLSVGSNRGWHVTGIEPNDKAAKHSNDIGLDVKNLMYTREVAAQLGKYDVVNLSLVLEHISDPIAMIKLVNSQLNEGGLICIVVPNDFNPFQTILHDHLHFNPWWVAPPHHINYFDFKSLEHLLNKCGFKMIHKVATFPIDMFLLMGDNYIGNDTIGRASHNKRIAFEKAIIESGNSELLTTLYKSMANAGIGREVVMIGKKEVNL